MEIRLRKCAEDQHRHRQLEDEFGKRNARLGLQIAGSDDGPADEYHQEDRQDIEGDIEHFARLTPLDAGIKPASYAMVRLDNLSQENEWRSL